MKEETTDEQQMDGDDSPLSKSSVGETRMTSSGEHSKPRSPNSRKSGKRRPKWLTRIPPMRAVSPTAQKYRLEVTYKAVIRWLYPDGVPDRLKLYEVEVSRGYMWSNWEESIVVALESEWVIAVGTGMLKYGRLQGELEVCLIRELLRARLRIPKGRAQWSLVKAMAEVRARLKRSGYGWHASRLGFKTKSIAYLIPGNKVSIPAGFPTRQDPSYLVSISHRSGRPDLDRKSVERVLAGRAAIAAEIRELVPLGTDLW